MYTGILDTVQKACKYELSIFEIDRTLFSSSFSCFALMQVHNDTNTKMEIWLNEFHNDYSNFESVKQTFTE